MSRGSSLSKSLSCSFIIIFISLLTNSPLPVRVQFVKAASLAKIDNIVEKGAERNLMTNLRLVEVAPFVFVVY